MADDFSFNIQQALGVISEGKGGWKTELNLVSWSERPAKYDIRPWDANHEKMGKGITLTRDELLKLRDLLNSADI